MPARGSSNASPGPPRRPRPQPGPERPQPLRIAATIADELAARVHRDSPDRGAFGRRGTNRLFEAGRSSAVDGRGAMVEGWSTIGPPLGPQRCNSEAPRDQQRTPRRERESRETGYFSFAMWLSLASAPWPLWLIVFLPLRTPGSATTESLLETSPDASENRISIITRSSSIKSVIRDARLEPLGDDLPKAGCGGTK
jgi:hypothetical protein